MNEEVKDLLNDLKNNNEHKKQQGYSKCFPDYYSLNYEDLDLLLNYIFNLQNRIDKAIEFTKKERKRENNTQPKDILDQQFKNGFTSALAQVEDILKESGE